MTPMALMLRAMRHGWTPVHTGMDFAALNRKTRTGTEVWICISESGIVICYERIDYFPLRQLSCFHYYHDRAKRRRIR